MHPELQLKDIESAIENKLINLLSKLREFKCVTTLILEFTKIEIDDGTEFSTFYSNSKAETIINESDIDDITELKLDSHLPKFFALFASMVAF